MLKTFSSYCFHREQLNRLQIQNQKSNKLKQVEGMDMSITNYISQRLRSKKNR